MNRIFRIVNLQTEYMNHPLGLDVPRPRFSWKLDGPEGTVQQSFRLRVFREGEKELLWDSCVLESACSTGIAYAGPPLMPKTRYEVKADVWDSTGRKAAASDWFETGFLDGDVSAWGGARWIGAPDYSLCADTLGVFSLSTK